VNIDGHEDKPVQDYTATAKAWYRSNVGQPAKSVWPNMYEIFSIGRVM
jgi:hypothetical protein